MSVIKFVWDETKNKLNIRKHKISFETASRIFLDPLALTKQDRIENGEYRWQTVGMTEGFHILLVAHTTIDDFDGSEIIRIISARLAEPKERKNYEQNCKL